MRQIKNMFKILRQTGIDKLLISYLLLMFICAVVLVIIEPTFHTLMDGIWYSVVTIATVGFGDLVVTTTLGKIISIILIFSGVLIVALLTGTLVNYYNTINEARQKGKLMDMLDKLENLPDLSKEELESISNEIKAMRFKD